MQAKVKVDHALGIAISYAWDAKTGEIIADQIIADFGAMDLANLEDALEEVCATVPDREKRPAQCLVVITKPVLSMYFLQTTSNADKSWAPWCRSSTSILIAGDTTNGGWRTLRIRKPTI